MLETSAAWNFILISFNCYRYRVKLQFRLPQISMPNPGIDKLGSAVQECLPQHELGGKIGKEGLFWTRKSLPRAQ